MKPPYPFIRTKLRESRIIPFLGAGASFGSRDPSAVPWRKPAAAAQDQWDVTFLPTGKELAECLAHDVEYPQDETRELTKVAQYFAVINGREPLEEALNQIFALRQTPAPIHECLAEMAADAPLLIVTTNYDDLIERAFDQAERPYDRVVHIPMSENAEIFWWRHGALKPTPLLAKELDIDLAKVSVIYKIHGAADRTSCGRGHYVITEDDYIDFLSRMMKNAAIPAIFAEPFQTRHFLFLGYSLSDWNLRVVLNRIERELRRPGDIKSWAIEARAKPLEGMLWQRRNVVVFDNLTMDQFAAALRRQARGAQCG